jgi:hypothetical protein
MVPDVDGRIVLEVDGTAGGDRNEFGASSEFLFF